MPRPWHALFGFAMYVCVFPRRRARSVDRLSSVYCLGRQYVRGKKLNSRGSTRRIAFRLFERKSFRAKSLIAGKWLVFCSAFKRRCGSFNTAFVADQEISQGSPFFATRQPSLRAQVYAAQPCIFCQRRDSQCLTNVRQYNMCVRERERERERERAVPLPSPWSLRGG
jgi:hypothetical protein